MTLERTSFLMTTTAELSGRTTGAMVRPMMSFEDPDFLSLYRDTTENLKHIFKTDDDVIIMHGEAILGLEATIVSLMENGEKCLVLVSGNYGEGFLKWVRSYGGEAIDIRVPFDSAIDPTDVESTCKLHPDIKLMFMLHCETLAGTLNPVREICTVAKKYGVVSVVDACTSMGSMEMSVSEWGIDVCIVGSQKCLGATPGLTNISVSENAWNRMKMKKRPLRSSYLSMLDWKELWLENGIFPYSPSISNIYALNEALIQITEEGLDKVIARHKSAAHVCRTGIRGMGLNIWPSSEAIAANSITVVELPDDINGHDLRRQMFEKHGVMVAPGFKEKRANLVGIAHMSRAANSMYVIVALAALEKTLADMGYKGKLGSGVTAALAVI